MRLSLMTTAAFLALSTAGFAQNAEIAPEVGNVDPACEAQGGEGAAKLPDHCMDGMNKAADETMKLDEPATETAETPAVEGASDTEATAEVEPPAVDPNAADATVAEVPVPAPATDMGAVEATEPNLVTPTAITSNELTGAPVYTGNGENIGEISNIVFTSTGSLEAAIVDVGGFLGFGEHRVGLTLDDLAITEEADSGKIRVIVDKSREQLEAMPVWDNAQIERTLPDAAPEGTVETQ